MRKKNILFLLCIYGLSVLVRCLLANRYYEVYTFYDELLHSKMTQSLAQKGLFMFRGIGNWKNDYLYYLFLLPAYSLNGGTNAITVIHLINALLMSSVIFPLYKLTGYFELNRRNRYIVCLLGILMPEMCYTGSILQENLFYPLSILYIAFLAYSEQEGRKEHGYVLLGILGGLLIDTKDTGIIVTMATLGTWMVDLLTHRDVKLRLKKTICYLIGIFSATVIIKFLLNHYWYESGNMLYELYRIEEQKGLSSTEYLLSNIDIGVLRQMGSFFVFFVIVSGFFPVLFSAGSLKSMKREQKNIVIAALFFLMGVIVSSCILEYHPKEIEVERIHYRYVYWIVPIFLTGFLFSVQNRCVSMKWFLLIGLSSTIAHMFCTSIVSGHLFDAVSAKPFSIVRNPVIYMIFKWLLVLIVLITAYCMYKQKNRIYPYIATFVVIVLFLTDFHSTRLQYRDVNNIRKESEADVIDAKILNGYIAEDSLALMVGKDVVSMATLECYYLGDYFYSLDSIYNENMENDFYTVMQVSRRYKVNKCEFEYIISENPIVSYQEIEIGLSKYHLYCELSE